MTDVRYDPSEIEPRWQKVWADEQTWHVSNGEASDREKSYVLVMLPYPSGELHIGHLKVYSVGDACAHFHRRIGQRVLNPMGYDAFGLPAENHAIKTGQHPRASTDEAIAAVPRQFHELGVSIDWSREFGTHEPRYYRWTQWIFLQLYERGLAYRKEAAVKWCPNDQTVLANEQVIDGRCERCGHEVEVKQLEQWFFRITDYADRLLDDLDTIEWPEHVKTMQRNWIGRSEGAEVIFRCEELGIDYPVFTTRPDTLFGATFFVLAPEHPDIERLAAGTGNEEAVREYVNRALNESAEERGDADKPKTGVPLGPHRDEPRQRRADPDVRRRLRADGVRHRRGHGGAGARPARLRLRDGVRPADPPGGGAGLGRGARRAGVRRAHRRRAARQLRRVQRAERRRGARTRSSAGSTARARATRRSSTGCATGCSRASATGAARSRSSTARACGLVPVPEDRPAGRAAGHRGLRAEGPLAARGGGGLGQRACPSCGGPARRETDTMDTFVDSSWYFLRYCDPTTTRPPWDRERCTSGCRSTSTSAASSTRSCT